MTDALLLTNHERRSVTRRGETLISVLQKKCCCFQLIMDAIIIFKDISRRINTLDTADVD